MNTKAEKGELRVMNGAAMRDHLRLVEECRWRDVKEQLPDDAITVLVACQGEDEPVWLGFYDSEAGKWVLWGLELDHHVTHWKHLPAPPWEKSEMNGRE